MRIIAAIAALTVVSACTTFETPETQRVSIDFVGSGYNSAANQYLSEATFAKVGQYNDGREFLLVEVDDQVWNSTINMYQPRRISFLKSEVPGYIAAIEKFEEWAAIATRDGDMISKEVAKVPTTNGQVRFQIFSGNEASHYLVTDFCVGYCLSEDVAVYFSRENAQELKQTLADFGAGKLAIDPDRDAKYQ